MPLTYLILILVAVSVSAIGGSLYGAYRHGVTVTNAECKAGQADALAQSNELQRIARYNERATQQRIDRIVSQTQEIVANDQANHRRELALIRAGAKRLRERFTCPDATVPGGTEDSGAGVGHETSKRGFQPADAAVALSITNEADDVVKQLTACQQIVNELTRDPK